MNIIFKFTSSTYTMITCYLLFLIFSSCNREELFVEEALLPEEEIVIDKKKDPLLTNTPEDAPEDDIATMLKAFPSAYGGGENTTGGRGGKVIHVTNLNDSGAGSLRAALLASGTRTIVFDVSGTITLTTTIELIEENSNFTVAGQTAPEGGITIAGNPIRMGGGHFRPSQPCNNAIWRYIRFRNGSYTGEPDVYFHNGFVSSGTDGLILDHCSFSFNDNQAIAMRASTGNLINITIQNSVFSENATGIIFGIVELDAFESGNFTSIHNLFVDQSHRTPNISTTKQVDIINNVYFNWISRLTRISSTHTADVNFIGNYMKMGKNTSNGTTAINKVDTSAKPLIYSAYNYHSNLHTTPILNDQDLWTNFSTSNLISSSLFRTIPFNIIGENFQIKSALQAYIDVLADVGTNKYLNADGTYGTYLDSFDTTKINNVKNNISSNPYNKSWTLPILPKNSRSGSYDTDGDGMPDVWERATFGDLSRDGKGDLDGDGYTDLEEFLNQVDK
ncbi:hypothetical protein [Confluentibacter citreus]|uniref:hypothetical protein n=1 Tax=Confluentibacter citreus TaxID=2007307 RepID=UPI0012FD02C6|nr:hypothetical protein [Confluentibacter citreus]